MIDQLPRQGEIVEAGKPDAGDEILYSVTSVLSVLDKPALIPWAVNETAWRVVRYAPALMQRIESEGEEAAIEWVSGLRWRTDGKLKATELGTVAHGCYEEYALTGVRPDVRAIRLPPKGDELHPEDMQSLIMMVDQFDRFLQEFQPEYLATEVVVFSPRDGWGVIDEGFGYAGTLDAIVRIDGQLLVVDYKTSRETYTKRNELRGPYPEAGLQLAAYRYALAAAAYRARRTSIARRRYYLLSADEKEMSLPMPEVDGGAIIYVTPERYGVYPARCGPSEFDAFLYTLEVARWQFNFASQMIGNPMMPPTALDAGDPFEGLPR